MTPKELAQEINNINWMSVQSDCPQASQIVQHLFCELERMNPKQALRLLMDVIEAKSLMLEGMGDVDAFKTLFTFEHVGSNLDNFDTSEFGN